MKILLFIFACLFPCFVLAQDNNQQNKDSIKKEIEVQEGKEKLRSINRLASMYFFESEDSLMMDTMLYYYNLLELEAKKQNDIKTQGIGRINTLSAFRNNKMYEEVVRRATDDLVFLRELESWTHYFLVYRSLVNTLLNMGNFEEATEKASKMYKEAEELKHEEGMGTSLFIMADH